MTIYFAIAALVGLLSTLSIAASRSLVTAKASNPTGMQTAGHHGVPPASRWTLFDVVAIGVMVTFSALRFQVGTDFNTYYLLYNKLDPENWRAALASSPQEPGFTALSLLLRSISDSPYLIFWVASALTIIPVYVTIKKQSVDPTMSLLLYVLLAFFVSPFNLVRQGIAISLNFWADSYLDDNKKAYVIINAVATTIHASVLLVLLAQFVARRWRPSLKFVTVVALGGVLAAIVYARVGASGAWLDVLNPRYQGYVSDQQVAGLGTYLIIATRLGLLLYVLAVTRGSGREGTTARQVGYVTFGLFFLILGTQSVAFSRMEMYFGIFLVLLIPNALGARRARIDKTAIVALSAVYFAFFLTHYAQLLPYQTQL